MAITSLNELLAAFASTRVNRPINKPSVASTGANEQWSLWRSNGNPPAATIPSAAAVCSNATAGSIAYVNPAPGKTGYLASAVMSMASAGTCLEIHDRLAHMGGLDGTVLTAQTVGVDLSLTSNNLTARKGASDYSDISWWLEIFTDLGTTVTTATISYTDSAGTSGLTLAVPFTGASPLMRAGRMAPIVPPAGVKIRSIESVTLSASSGAAGNFGVVATRKLVMLAAGAANLSNLFDWSALGLPKIEDDPCLMFSMICSTTSTGVVAGTLSFISG